MSPGELGILLVIAIGCAFGADQIGKRKGYGWGFPAGLILGVIGLLIMACLPVSEEGRVQREEARLRAQAEAQRRIDAERDREYRP